MSKELLKEFLAGSERAIGRVLTEIENNTITGRKLLREIYPRTGRAIIIGITGAPGAGKSTFIEMLAPELKRVAIIAVDPSSPLTGGALLGDRIRMAGATSERNVFMRSVASRGALGGVASSTFESLLALDAAGFDYILVETVGVGQSEVDIARLSDLTLLLLVPGMGDGVQMLKAGLLEVADLFVINKADYDGADRLEKELISAEFGRPVVRTVASRRAGALQVLSAIGGALDAARASGAFMQRREAQLRYQMQVALREQIAERVLKLSQLASFERAVSKRKLDPRTAAEKLLAGT